MAQVNAMLDVLQIFVFLFGAAVVMTILIIAGQSLTHGKDWV
jgi:hypothetical protein